MVEKVKKAVKKVVKKAKPEVVAFAPTDKKTKKVVAPIVEAVETQAPEYFEGKLVVSKEVVVKGDKKYWDITVENGVVFREPYE